MKLRPPTRPLPVSTPSDWNDWPRTVDPPPDTDPRLWQIDPFQLQLLCRHVELEVIRRRKHGERIEVVDAAFLGGDDGMRQVVRRYYLDALREVRGWHVRRRARAICQEILLDPGGREAEGRGPQGILPETARQVEERSRNPSQQRRAAADQPGVGGGDRTAGVALVPGVEVSGHGREAP